MKKLEQALLNQFQRHRIVFWYDSKKELRQDYESLKLPNIHKVEIKNNQFALKHLILREQAKQKFLLYHEGPAPQDIDNWLLDVQLSHGEFREDQEGIWLSQLGLGIDFSPVIRDHINFFKSARFREKLKKVVNPDLTHSKLRMHMLAICTASEPRIDEIMEHLLTELAEERDEKIKVIQRCQLQPFLWKQLEILYLYKSESSGILDFALSLFESCYRQGIGSDSHHHKSSLNNDAVVFLKRWRDNKRHEASFATLSHRYAKEKNIQQDLIERETRDILELDYFRCIDEEILTRLVSGISQRTLSAGECEDIIRIRRQSHWYNQFLHYYQALDHAAQFLHQLNEADLTIQSMNHGIQNYTQSWHRLDQRYRNYIFHLRKAQKPGLLAPISQAVEDHYTTNFLLKVNNNWQQIVDTAPRWEASPIPLQSQFFHRYVSPLLEQGKRVAVIVSDAFRYEIAAQFLHRLHRSGSHEGRIEPMLGMLPSFTQLGMAALLPHKELQFNDNGSGTVLVDRSSSQGTGNRGKLLQKALKGNAKAVAIKSEELEKLTNRDRYREFVSQYKLIYVYHNHIDATGDKRETEERVFDAVEETQNEILAIVKKLGDRISNLLITTDHGFIYQHQEIEENDFSLSSASGTNVSYRHRRFILGRGLTPQPGLFSFQPSQLGLKGDTQIQIAKSINRMRLQGSGSRYVHGGGSLQEVVLPVIHISKKARVQVNQVEVETLRGSTNIISTGQISVTFYQSTPTTPQVQPRTLEAAIYTKDNRLISDTHRLNFDFTSLNDRQRETKVRFILTREANDLNGQEVFLELREQVTGTTHFKTYQSVSYTMRRSFSSDF
jgi:uncharacterized protein (TIGR02687 family)